MPTYEWSCKSGHEWDVVTSVATRDDPCSCPQCQEPGLRREITRTNFMGASDWNTQTFNPALGVVTRNNRHARQIAKAKGMIEVGNEPVEKLHKHFDTVRQEKREQRYRDAADLK